MGYWGYYVVGRSERPLAELGALAEAEALTLCVTADDGWQIWAYPTGAPVPRLPGVPETPAMSAT